MSQTAVAHADHTMTGIPSNKLGMWLFLASEVMFFTALMAAFVVIKMGHPAWPGDEGHINVWVGTFNTFLLICSSMTIVMALAAQARGRTGAMRGWLLATILLGTAFLAIKGVEYAQKFEHHIGPSTNVFWSGYFALTGFHGLHVLGGVVANAWILSLSLRNKLKSYPLELSGLYWHFVDIVWIFLFPLLYLFN